MQNAEPTDAEDAAGDLPGDWKLPTRFLFRFAALYFVLYALPFPFAELWGLVGSVIQLFEIDVVPPASDWMAVVNGFFYGDPMDPGSSGFWRDTWQSITSWLGESGWTDLSVIHQRTGSGDTAHNLLKLCTSTVIAFGLALLWSLILRGPTQYRRLGRWLHLGVRWYLAFALLGYGLIKFYAGQFSYPGLNRLLTPVGDTSPMGLVWTFMGFSKPYEVFAGLGETAAGLLLLSRRTSALGCFVAIATMTNVVLLNWLFDVPVKLYSSNLLLFSIALLVPDLGRLSQVFVTNKPAAPVRLGLTGYRFLNHCLTAFGCLWIGVHLYGAHERNMSMLEMVAIETPELYGVWEVDYQFRDGEQIEVGDPRRWELLAIDRRGFGWVRTLSGKTESLRIEEDLPNGILEVAPASARSVTSTWTFERGETLVDVPDPAPKEMTDFNRQVEVERPTLLIQGRWDDADLEVYLVRKSFRLERGFHLVQEMPFNR